MASPTKLPRATSGAEHAEPHIAPAAGTFERGNSRDVRNAFDGPRGLAPARSAARMAELWEAAMLVPRAGCGVHFRVARLPAESSWARRRASHAFAQRGRVLSQAPGQRRTCPAARDRSADHRSSRRFQCAARARSRRETTPWSPCPNLTTFEELAATAELARPSCARACQASLAQRKGAGEGERARARARRASSCLP